MTAVNYNSKEVVQLLLDGGAYVIHGEGLTAPMGLAEEKGHQMVLMMLFNGWLIKTGQRRHFRNF